MSKEKFLELLGERIRQLRCEGNTSLNQFAAAIGIAASHLSQIERGEADPKLSVVISIINELDISISDLLSDFGGKPLTVRR